MCISTRSLSDKLLPVGSVTTNVTPSDVYSSQASRKGRCVDPAPRLNDGFPFGLIKTRICVIDSDANHLGADLSRDGAC